MARQNRPTIVPRRARPAGGRPDAPILENETSGPWEVLIQLPDVETRAASWSFASLAGLAALGPGRSRTVVIGSALAVSLLLVGGVLVGRLALSGRSQQTEAMEVAPAWTAESITPPTASRGNAKQTSDTVAPDDLSIDNEFSLPVELDEEIGPTLNGSFSGRHGTTDSAAALNEPASVGRPEAHVARRLETTSRLDGRRGPLQEPPATERTAQPGVAEIKGTIEKPSP